MQFRERTVSAAAARVCSRFLYVFFPGLLRTTCSVRCLTFQNPESSDVQLLCQVNFPLGKRLHPGCTHLLFPSGINTKNVIYVVELYFIIIFSPLFATFLLKKKTSCWNGCSVRLPTCLEGDEHKGGVRGRSQQLAQAAVTKARVTPVPFVTSQRLQMNFLPVLGSSLTDRRSASLI